MSPPAICCGDDTEPGQQLPGDAAADTEFQAGQVSRLLQLLAEPAAHLAAGVAGRNAVHVELLEELVQQIHAAGRYHPGVLHARVEPERHCGAERKGRILARVVVRRGVRDLDGRTARRRRAPARQARFRRRQTAESGTCCRSLRRLPCRTPRRRRKSCRAISESSRSGAISTRASIARSRVLQRLRRRHQDLRS